MTFVDYDDESIAVKLPKLVWLFQNIIHKRIEVHVSTSLSIFVSCTETVKYNKIWKCTKRTLIIHISKNICSSSSSSDKVSSHTA